MVYYF